MIVACLISGLETSPAQLRDAFGAKRDALRTRLNALLIEPTTVPSAAEAAISTATSIATAPTAIAAGATTTTATTALAVALGCVVRDETCEIGPEVEVGEVGPELAQVEPTDERLCPAMLAGDDARSH